MNGWEEELSTKLFTDLLFTDPINNFPLYLMHAF